MIKIKVVEMGKKKAPKFKAVDVRKVVAHMEEIVGDPMPSGNKMCMGMLADVVNTNQMTPVELEIAVTAFIDAWRSTH